MKLTNIVEEGICGINVELTTFDRYTIAETVAQYAAYEQHLKDRKEWEEKRREATKGMKWEEREQWDNQNPSPKYDAETPQKIAATWFKFMKKLVPASGVSNVFAD